MTVEIDIIYKCNECSKEYHNEYDANVLCDRCLEKHETIQIKSAVVELLKKKYIWEDREGYGGFKTEEEKTLYMRGVKRGFEVSLFWLCDHFGEVEFWEKLEGGD